VQNVRASGSHTTMYSYIIFVLSSAVHLLRSGDVVCSRGAGAARRSGAVGWVFKAGISCFQGEGVMGLGGTSHLKSVHASLGAACLFSQALTRSGRFCRAVLS
jgi:hypothetical protein